MTALTLQSGARDGRWATPSLGRRPTLRDGISVQADWAVHQWRIGSEGRKPVDQSGSQRGCHAVSAGRENPGSECRHRHAYGKPQSAETDGLREPIGHRSQIWDSGGCRLNAVSQMCFNSLRQNETSRDVCRLKISLLNPPFSPWGGRSRTFESCRPDLLTLHNSAFSEGLVFQFELRSIERPMESLRELLSQRPLPLNGGSPFELSVHPGSLSPKRPLLFEKLPSHNRV